MKKKVLICFFATMLVLTGCGSKAATNASESAIVDTLAVSQTETTEKTQTIQKEEKSEATCTTGALVANVCSECGASGGTSEAGGALGHDLQRHADGEATCTYSPYYYVQCSRCGEVTESGHEGTLAHNMVAVSVQEGDCVTPTVTQYACSDCGANGGSEYSVSGDHDWVEGLSAPYWSEEAQDFVQDPTTYCSRCNTHQ